MVERRRKKANREPSPSVGVIDSQSRSAGAVKCSEWGVVPKGFDGNKKENGHKHHIVVDTLGLVLVVVVHAANQHDSLAARAVLTSLARQGYERMSKILADSAYGKKISALAQEVLRTDSGGGQNERVRRFLGRAHALEGGTNFYLDELVPSNQQRLRKRCRFA
ncbi:transposase [Spirosoma aerolatum]|uniref:transposase n=1 Tax=Spirosoma aerolatum TaxID=1211326 RepID=UPI0009AEFBB4|nr:transposase [Spirosoma aerolatum]